MARLLPEKAHQVVFAHIEVPGEGVCAHILREVVADVFQDFRRLLVALRRRGEGAGYLRPREGDEQLLYPQSPQYRRGEGLRRILRQSIGEMKEGVPRLLRQAQDILPRLPGAAKAGVQAALGGKGGGDIHRVPPVGDPRAHLRAVDTAPGHQHDVPRLQGPVPPFDAVARRAGAEEDELVEAVVMPVDLGEGDGVLQAEQPPVLLQIAPQGIGHRSPFFRRICADYSTKCVYRASALPYNGSRKT